MITSKLVRLPPSDPRRCGEAYKFGHCPYQAVENTTKCIIHGGISAYNIYVENEKYMYRSAKWSQRIKEFAEDDKVKSLREEIGVSRLLLEETLNKCQDPTELLLYSSPILEIVRQINALVVNCTKLEDRLGLVLDKSTVINLADQILDIVKEFLSEESFEMVASRIELAIVDIAKVNNQLEFNNS